MCLRRAFELTIGGRVVSSPLNRSHHAPGNGNAVEEDTQDVEQNVLEMLGAEEWEGVAVGFLLAKVIRPLSYFTTTAAVGY